MGNIFQIPVGAVSEFATGILNSGRYWRLRQEGTLCPC